MISALQLGYLSMFMITFFGLASHRAHLMSTLLCLEGMMLSLFLALTAWYSSFGALLSSPAPLILLAFSAGEASVGLALLVATSRTHGAPNVQNLTLLQC